MDLNFKPSLELILQRIALDTSKVARQSAVNSLRGLLSSIVPYSYKVTYIDNLGVQREVTGTVATVDTIDRLWQVEQHLVLKYKIEKFIKTTYTYYDPSTGLQTLSSV